VLIWGGVFLVKMRMGGLRNGEGFEIKQPVGVGVLLRITSGARGLPTIQCVGEGYLRVTMRVGGY
jgi:hypothetical protein